MMRVFDSFSYTVAGSPRLYSAALKRGHHICARSAGFVRCRARRAVVLILLLSLLSTAMPAAPQTMMRLTSDLSTSLSFWYHHRGWDAKLMQIRGRGRAADKSQERQEDRSARISRVEIFPGDVTIQVDEQVFFAAVAYDQQGRAIGGASVTWSCLDEGRNRAASISQRGDFLGSTPGKFNVTAETSGGKRAHVRVTVTEGAGRKRGEKPNRSEQVSTRDQPQTPAQPPAPRSEQKVERFNSHASKSGKLRKDSASRATAATTALAAMALPADGWDSTNYWSADDPENTRGNPPAGTQDDGAGNGNFQVAAPVVTLPGRGIDLNLGLVYNSRVWNKTGSQITFDIDRDWPAPGWSLGFGKIVGIGVDKGSMIVEPDGTRRSYAGTVYYGPNLNYTDFDGHTTDGSFIDYTHRTGLGGALVSARATYPNGTVFEYGAQGTGAMYPTRITDANGNFITITYVNNQGPRIQTVTDTLGRLISFHYDAANLLTAITAPGLGSDTRTLVRLHYAPLTISSSFNGLTPVVRNQTPYLIDAIYYPATGTGYWFADADSYSPYGMITKVIEQRTMGFDSSSLNDQGTVTPGAMTRQEAYGFQYDNLTDAPTYTSLTETWTRDGVSTDQAVTGYEVHENSTPRTVTITLPNGTKSTQYSYNAPGQFNDGLIYLDETRDADNTVLQSSASAWQQGAYDSPRPTRVESTDALGQMTATEFVYGPLYNQVTQTRNYDYGGQTLLRSTHTEYENSLSYTSRHIFNLVKAVEVYAGDNITRVSRTEYQFDGQTLKDTPDVVMHDDTSNPYAPVRTNPGRCYYDYDYYYCDPDYTTSDYNQSTDFRGNVTRVTTYADAGTEPASGAVTEIRQYDITGNLVLASTSCCQQTSVLYTSATQYAYPASQTRGSSDPNSPVHLTGSATYDFNTGLELSTTDPNGRVTQLSYDAVALRPQTTYSPTGAYISYAYDESGLNVTETLYAADGTMASQEIKFLNGRGQARQYKALGAGGVWDQVDMEYDAFGRLTRQSLPYRSGEQIQWGTTSYDALGRVTSSQAPDGSTTQLTHNSASRPAAASSAPGQTTKVTDAWGRERWGRTDANDRLVEVVEPEADGNGSVASGGYQTTYSYDTLGNLMNVTQGAQTRSFQYDSLGRMTHQKLAEASATLDDSGHYVATGGKWSEFFSYDERSNLISRTDARGVKTVFNYNDDPLNRLQSMSFDTTGFGDTSHPVLEAPSITYAYMTTGDITRLSSVTTANVSTESFAYDSEARLGTRTQTLLDRPGYAMVTDYIYDTVDRITDIRYPAEYETGAARRKVLHQDYDVASRLSRLKVDGTDYASQITYNAANQSTTIKVGAGGGNQLTENYAYNTQTGLLENQRVVRGTQSLLDLSYDYVGANGKRTGQLVKVTNNLDASHNHDRSYAYDALGRLMQARGGLSTSPLWTQTYSYDRYGNRLSVTATGNVASLSAPDASQPQQPTAELAANTTIPTAESVREEAMRGVSDSSFSIFSSTRSSRSSDTTRAAAQPMFAPLPSSNLVISQIYGGGGNTGATYKNDFIEVFNRGTSSVDLSGWSVQYAPAGSATWQVTPLTGSLAPGQYLLVQEAQGAGGTTSLPTPNASGNIEINATAGKVALVNNSTPLSSAAPSTASGIIDLVGYGTSAGYFEGSGPATAPSNTLSTVRARQGCIETDNNATDFEGGTPGPRNNAATLHTCTPPPSSTTVVISEFRTRGPAGSNDEFIELYNQSDVAINLSGWKIKASNNAGAVTTRIVVNAGTTLPAHGHFLATNTGSGGYSGTVGGDQTYSTGIADDGGIAVTRADDVIVDQVGMSAGSAFKENRTLSTLATNVDRSYERKSGGTNPSMQDTDDGPSDFQIRTPSDPHNLSSAPPPPPPPPANQPPAASPGGPYSGATGTTIDFNGSNSTDPDGTISAYAWEFGDGATATGPTPQHTYATAGNYTARLTITDNQNAQSSATATVNVANISVGGGTGCSSQNPLAVELYVQNFFQGAFNRQPTPAELQSWSELLRQNYYQGQARLLAAAQYMGEQLFHTNEYNSRNRSDREYVYDLYSAYLQRGPDQPSWDTWTGLVATSGRDAVRRGFDQSQEFADKMATLCPGGTGGGAVPTDGLANLSYHEGSNRIRTAGYDYDAAGNLTRAQASAGGAWQRYQYNAAGRLIHVRDDNNAILASYTYGASNRRLSSSEGTTRTYYAWSGEATLAEYTESTTTPGTLQWSQSYVYLGARLLATLQPDNQGAESTQFHHPDRLGTRLITSASDSSVREQVALPYGTALDSESTGSTSKRFTTYDRSKTTGLDYAVNRTYDSAQGRFTQVDPLGMSATSLTDPQSLNLYAYCGNDPVNRVDPTGLFWGKLFRWIGHGISKLFKVATRVAMKLLSNKWVQLLIGVVILTLASPFAPIFFAELGAGEGLISYMTASLLITGLQAAGAVSTHLQQRRVRRRGRRETGRAVPLSGPLLSLFKLARNKALKLLGKEDSPCAQFLSDAGFNPAEVAANLESSKPYDWARSTNNAGDINSLYDQYKMNEVYKQSRAVTNNPGTRTYYRASGIRTSTQIHETLHRVSPGLSDPELAEKLGILKEYEKAQAAGQGSTVIDDELEKAGCK
jgi:RHS repeat-associated protein